MYPKVFIDSENYRVDYFSMIENNWISRWLRDQIKAMLLEQHEAFWQRDASVERSRAVLPHGEACAARQVVPGDHPAAAFVMAVEKWTERALPTFPQPGL